MSIEYIQKSLDIALKQFGIDNGIIIALEDIDAPTDTSVPYLASYQINTGATVSDLGTTYVRTGFYQVDVNYKEGSGSAVFNRMLDLINQTFNSGASFTFSGVCVEILDVQPSVLIIGGGLSGQSGSAGWAKHALTINWSSYTARI